MSNNNKLHSFPPCTPYHRSCIHIIPINPQSRLVFEDEEPTLVLVDKYCDDFIDHYEVDIDHIDCKLYPNPIKGYQKHINPVSGSELPLCCQFHQDIFEESRQWFEIFPDCCEHHKEMAKESWFNKDNYSFMPDKIVTQISYTEHVITEKISEPDWYEAITGYIDHNFVCFGVFAIGLNIYLSNLVKYIKASGDILPTDKAEKLIAYINHVGRYYKYSLDWEYTPPEIKKWIDNFPLKEDYFKNLEEIYTSNMAALLPFDTNTGKHSYAAVPYHFDDEKLKESLKKLTRKIITQINSLTLLEKGELNDPKKLKRNLVIERRRFELRQLAQEDNSGNPGNKYMKILEKWVEGEIKFLEDIISTDEGDIAPQEAPPDTVAEPLKLVDLFEDVSKFKQIMELLVEKEYCQSHTYTWKDEKAGYKTLIAALLKHLHLKGYYKNNTRPTNEQIKEIAANTFGVEIGIDTIKRADSDRTALNFIPGATTLNS